MAGVDNLVSTIIGHDIAYISSRSRPSTRLRAPLAFAFLCIFSVAMFVFHRTSVRTFRSARAGVVAADFVRGLRT